MRITLVRGDITEQEVDVIVNAANSSLLGGGGVDGTIHDKGGPTILAACKALRRTDYQQGLTTGEAVATTGGDLPAKWVIHAVGPVWSPPLDRADLLRSCYRESLRVAGELGARTIAFPAISAGVYRWPIDDAARQAVMGIRQAAPTTVEEVRIVAFNDEVYEAFQRALADNGGVRVSADE